MTTAPKTPAQLADAAVESVRSLNHATLSPRDGWRHPGDAYSTVANLAALARMLPQVLGQLESLIGRLEDAGGLTNDRGPEKLPEDMIRFHGSVSEAIAKAHDLGLALDGVHAALGPIGCRE